MHKDSIMQKISKLLALAEATGSEAEAEAAYTRAQSLATAHSISIAVARQNKIGEQKPAELLQERVHVGVKGKHVNSYLISLFSEIAGAQDVKINIAHNSTYVNAFGYETDIEITKELWSSIAVQMVRFADSYIRKGEWRSETTWREKTVKDSWGYSEKVYGEYSVTAQAARTSFYRSFNRTIGERLLLAVTEAQNEAKEGHFHADVEMPENVVITSESVSLALVEKESAVRDYYRDQSTARGSWKGARGGYSGGGRAAGAAAGARANIGRGAAVSGAGRAVGR